MRKKVIKNEGERKRENEGTGKSKRECGKNISFKEEHLWEKKNWEFKKKGGREGNKCSGRKDNGREERMDRERKGKVMCRDGESQHSMENIGGKG